MATGMVHLQLGVHGGEHALLDARRGGDVVRAVDQDLGLDDGHKAELLAGVKGWRSWSGGRAAKWPAEGAAWGDVR